MTVFSRVRLFRHWIHNVQPHGLSEPSIHQQCIRVSIRRSGESKITVNNRKTYLCELTTKKVN